MPSKERGGYKRVDLTKFDRSDEAFLAHWRGFSKYQQPDGTVVACASADSDGMGLMLGPCVSGEACDRLISDFYCHEY